MSSLGPGGNGAPARAVCRREAEERVRRAKMALLELANPPSPAASATGDQANAAAVSPSQAWTLASIALGAGVLAGMAGLSKPILDAAVRLVMDQLHHGAD